MTDTHLPVLSTLNADGSRQWLKPRLSPGRFWKRRAFVAYALMALFFLLPFLRLNNKPAVLLDIPTRHFTILGYTFLPTDTVLLALFMLTLFLGIFFFTALFGRLWCGWACPQTVYLEYLYRPLERLFDNTLGRGGNPKTPPGGLRKSAYFALAFLATLIPAHTFLAYFVGASNLRHWILSSPLNHPAAFTIMLATTLLMFFDFYFFREQLCILACPYGRFQSVLLDKWSLIVSYDRTRGEPRSIKNQKSKLQNPGDCVDCNLCVQTCPTGIDIRDGLQMECVNCTQCIDACDAVMDKLKKPRGLIRYSSQAAIDAPRQPNTQFPLPNTRLKLRPRVILYPLLLTLLLSLFTLLLLTKSPADIVLTRTPGNPYMSLSSGEIANSFRLKLVNRTDVDATYTITTTDNRTQIQLAEDQLPIPAGQSRQLPCILAADPSVFSHGSAYITLRITDGKAFTKDISVRVLGPGGSFGGNP